MRRYSTDRADKKADFGSDRLGTLGQAEDCLHTTDCPSVPGYTTRGHSIMWVNVKQFWPVNVSEQRSDPKTTLRRGEEKMRFY